MSFGPDALVAEMLENSPYYKVSHFSGSPARLPAVHSHLAVHSHTPLFQLALPMCHSTMTWHRPSPFLSLVSIAFLLPINKRLCEWLWIFFCFSPGIIYKKYLVINSDNDNSCLLEPLDFSKIFFSNLLLLWLSFVVVVQTFGFK